MANISTYLLAAIGVCFIIQLISPAFEDLFIFDPYLALSQPWRFLTSIFLHADPMHLFFNAYALFMFGSILETRIRARDYLIIFFGAGLIGSVLYYLTTIGPWPPLCGTIRGAVILCPALGASGAIYGILGAVAVLLPNLRIFFMFFPVRMREAAILWLVLEFLGTFNQFSGIGSAAHLGGLVFGLGYAWYVGRRPVEIYGQSWGWEQRFE